MLSRAPGDFDLSVIRLTYRWEIIELQKVGFSRDSAREIFQKSNYYGLYFDEKYCLRFANSIILNDENEQIKREANEIFVNKADVFVNDFDNFRSGVSLFCFYLKLHNAL